MRAETALRLFVEEGLTRPQIAAELGITGARVRQLIDDALAESAERRHKLADYAVEVELLLIDKTISETTRIFLRKCDACKGDEDRRILCMACKKTGFFYPVHRRFAAIDRCGRAQARRIKLLGLEKVAQAEQAGNVRRELYAEFEQLSDEEIGEQLAALQEPHQEDAGAA